MYENNQVVARVKRRFAYRLGDSLPQPLRFVYYFLLVVTLLYVIYRIIDFIRSIIHKIFDEKFFYIILGLSVLVAIIVIVILQRYTDINPIGTILDIIERVRIFIYKKGEIV